MNKNKIIRKGQKQGLFVIIGIFSFFLGFGSLQEREPLYKFMGFVGLVIFLFSVYMIFAAKDKNDNIE